MMRSHASQADRAVHERAGCCQPTNHRFASTEALDSFLPLVRCELARPTEPHAAILRTLTPPRQCAQRSANARTRRGRRAP
jgi:hypothetical protein